jgi:hypothetical protein
MLPNFRLVADVVHIAQMNREVRLEPKYPFSYRGCFMGASPPIASQAQPDFFCSS